MKKKNILRIITLIVAVSLCLLFQNDVHAMTSEEAGKYVAEFAINFFDAHASETIYSYTQSQRSAAYQGNKTSGISGSAHPTSFTDKYGIDCVGWVSMAIHQAIGIGGTDWGEFGIPYPNNAPGFFNGYECVLGQGGSRNKISLSELKQKLKPGDVLLKNDKHVLLYVGDNTLIHCNGHGPGAEYGGDSGYGLTKESLDHFYNSGYGIEAVGRLTESAAASINESNCTTIFGQTGSGLTGVWEKASKGGVGVSSSNSNLSSINLSSTLAVEGMNEDLTLGLRYPKDNNNTSLNSFIDFTLPYLQTWMIPLAMNSGIMSKTNTEEDQDSIKNPMFGYLTIKEAMSDILIDRYDVTKCTLKTKYKVYDVITYEVSYDSNDKKWVKKEISRTSVDESSNGAMAETFVSKKFDVETKYYIKKAYTFDVKIDNECTYKKYSDSDVENRIENTENGFLSKDPQQRRKF